MNQKAIATTIVLASTVLVAVFATTSYPMAFAQSESETETEQEIDQKNVCSGWAVCTNGAKSNIDSSVEDAQILIATPN
jgi:hypothetical protein